MKKFFAALFLVIVSVAPSAFAQKCPEDMALLFVQSKVRKFFSNYSVIGNWPRFQSQQKVLLSSDLVTVVSDHQGSQTYSGPDGYFASLGDWSQQFSTGDDFHTEITEVTRTKITVRLHGKIVFKSPINGLTEITDKQHSWTEIFTLESHGIITNLEVQMNLFK